MEQKEEKLRQLGLCPLAWTQLFRECDAIHDIIISRQHSLRSNQSQHSRGSISPVQIIIHKQWIWYIFYTTHDPIFSPLFQTHLTSFCFSLSSNVLVFERINQKNQKNPRNKTIFVLTSIKQDDQFWGDGAEVRAAGWQSRRRHGHEK